MHFQTIFGIIGAKVLLYPDGKVDSMSFRGETNAAGECLVGTIFANHQKPGVPPGSYKIVVEKVQIVEETKTDEEKGAMSRPQLDAYFKEMQNKRDALPKIIPVPLTKPSSTPLKIEVPEGGTEMNIDLAEYK